AEEAPGHPEPLREAIRAYEEALRLDPADAAAKWNLELAVKRLTDDRTSGGSPGRGRNADYGRGNMNNPGYEGNPEAAVGAAAGGARSGRVSACGSTPISAQRSTQALQRPERASPAPRLAPRGPIAYCAIDNRNSWSFAAYCSHVKQMLKSLASRVSFWHRAL